eukprot:9987921-Alexandrium_andersonii.AAC.1
MHCQLLFVLVSGLTSYGYLDKSDFLATRISAMGRILAMLNRSETEDVQAWCKQCLVLPCRKQGNSKEKVRILLDVEGQMVIPDSKADADALAAEEAKEVEAGGGNNVQSSPLQLPTKHMQLQVPAKLMPVSE